MLPSRHELAPSVATPQNPTGVMGMDSLPPLFTDLPLQGFEMDDWNKLCTIASSSPDLLEYINTNVIDTEFEGSSGETTWEATFSEGIVKAEEVFEQGSPSWIEPDLPLMMYDQQVEGVHLKREPESPVVNPPTTWCEVKYQRERMGSADSLNSFAPQGAQQGCGFSTSNDRVPMYWYDETELSGEAEGVPHGTQDMGAGSECGLSTTSSGCSGRSSCNLDAKRERRREQNRKAAKTCRNRKKSAFDALRQEHDEAKALNIRYQCEIQRLKKLIEDKNNEIELHQRVCGMRFSEQ